MELRIAFVTYELVPGGSVTFLIHISREFRRRNVAHRIISLHPRHPLERDFSAAGVRLRSMPLAPSGMPNHAV